MSFADVKDQETALRLLRNVLAKDRIPNALLFWGPRGVGKRFAAFELAKAMNCTEQRTDSCGECLACRKTANGNHPDLRTISPARKSRLIDLETMADAVETAALRPYESDWRIFIIRDAERMTPQAQNRFLKTLEEPPGQSLFILTTEYPRVLLPTIRSRCQQVRFRRLRPETVVAFLREQRDLPEDVAAAIAALAQGQMTRALDLVDSEKRAIAMAVSERLAGGDDPVVVSEEFSRSLKEQHDRIAEGVASEISAEEKQSMSPEDREALKETQMAAVDALHRQDTLEYLYLLETWYRDLLVREQADGWDHVLNKDLRERLENENPAGASGKIEAIEAARVHLDRYLSQDRVFRDLFLALAAQ